MRQCPRYSLTAIVGTGHDEFLLTAELALPRPAAHLLEGRKTVLIDQVDITLGSLLLQGRLRAAWTYQVAEICQDGLISGPVWSTSADIGFVRHMAVAGARPGMDCRVLKAHVSADASLLPTPTVIGERSVLVISVEVTTAREMPPPVPTVVAAPHKGRIIGHLPPPGAGKPG